MTQRDRAARAGEAFATAALAKCARDEVYMRKQVYPHRVSQGRMTQARADREIAMMTAIAERLEADAAKERLL